MSIKMSLKKFTEFLLQERRKPMAEVKSTTFIVRDPKDPAKQMQVIVNYEDRSIGVVHNADLELLVIETAVLHNIPVIYKTPETTPIVTPLDVRNLV